MNTIVPASSAEKSFMLIFPLSMTLSALEQDSPALLESRLDAGRARIRGGCQDPVPRRSGASVGWPRGIDAVAPIRTVVRQVSASRRRRAGRRAQPGPGPHPPGFATGTVTRVSVRITPRHNRTEGTEPRSQVDSALGDRSPG